MIVLQTDGILLKLNEFLEDLILYDKTLDKNNKQTSPPTRVLFETFNNFYFDKDI